MLGGWEGGDSARTLVDPTQVLSQHNSTALPSQWTVLALMLVHWAGLEMKE